MAPHAGMESAQAPLRTAPNTSLEKEDQSLPAEKGFGNERPGDEVKAEGIKLKQHSPNEIIYQVDGPGVAFAKGLAKTKKVTTSVRVPHDGTIGIAVPQELQDGTSVTRVTRKKRTTRMFRLDVSRGRVVWDQSWFVVDDMREVQTAASARDHREELQMSAEVEDRWITITYAHPEDNGKLKLLHIIAPTVELFEMWTVALEAIHGYWAGMMGGLAMQAERFIDTHWRNCMATRESTSPPNAQSIDEGLTFEDVERFCRRLHINASKRFLRDRFKRADMDNSGYLNFMEFRRFVILLKEREELQKIWEESVQNSALGMDESEYLSFLKDVQHVDVCADTTHVMKVFRKFCRQSWAQQKSEGDASDSGLQREPLPREMRISREAFGEFLLSSLYNPPLLTVPAFEISLDRPLNEYYCSSSHNTYLMGRQVKGESSVEGYIRALQHGCRCVEIDVWDGNDGLPVVTHGHTRSTQVLFEDVINAISKHAFLASPYPVIISLEVHCAPEQQTKMVGCLKSILGRKLVTKPLTPRPMTLPNPEALKHRFIMKVKGSMGTSNYPEKLVESGSALEEGQFSTEETKIPGIGSSLTSSCGASENDLSEPYLGAGQSDASEGDTSKEGATAKVAPTKILPELGNLGVYCRGQKFKDFALPESQAFNHCFSFQEKSLIKFCKNADKEAQLEKHNVRYLMRVYPSGFRVNSSNYDPLGFWRRGVQLAALNWQTYDIGLQLNQAMFSGGADKTGYVLKPLALRSSSSPPELPIALKEKKVGLSIEVISAQQLPRPKGRKYGQSIDPFVEVEVFSADDKSRGISSSEGGINMGGSNGKSGLGASQKRKTLVVQDDGFHPIFGERMKFRLMTKFVDFIFVRFSVYNADSATEKSIIATYTAKLISLQQALGYRHLPLVDCRGEQYLFSTLFVNVQVDAPVIIDDWEVPIKTSKKAVGTLKSAKSVLSRGFSAERESIRRHTTIDRAGKRRNSQQLGTRHDAADGGQRDPVLGTGSRTAP